MLQVLLIGHIGAQAEIQNYDGGKFVKFRVAHTESWKDEHGEKQSRTTWVDCTMNCPNGEVPAVFPYLTAGAQVFVKGDVRLRVYSSQVDRCMKAGMTIVVREIELLGGKADPIPRRLFSQDGQTMYDIVKYYNVNTQVPKEGMQLVDKNGQLFNVDKNGWVTAPSNEQTQADDTSK